MTCGSKLESLQSFESPVEYMKEIEKVFKRIFNTQVTFMKKVSAKHIKKDMKSEDKIIKAAKKMKQEDKMALKKKKKC